jgi:hypothetical protein
MKRQVVAQQGEVKVFKIDRLPDGMTTKPVDLDKNGLAIISHSESGHHHVIGGADVLERTDNVPNGMAILYAIVKDPTVLRQDAPTPHESIPLEADSIYELRISREFDPFAEQARRVAD